MTDEQLNAVFSALADPTRRAMLQQLAKGQASVGDLAAPFAMSQPAISKHLKVLERAGLVERWVDGQVRPTRLRPEKMAEAVAWLEQFERFWSDGFDALDNVLAEMKKQPGDKT